MRYRDMTPEQRKARNARVRKYRAEHREEHKEYTRKWRTEHKDEHDVYMSKYISEDLNKNGMTKHRVRKLSRQRLFKTHTKLNGYEIHHCFGYDDTNKFIYIPKTLHLQIHQLLKDNNISADSNHWNAIRGIVNSCEEYTYIRD